MKICKRCQIEKELTEFSLRLTGKDAGKRRTRCKSCLRSESFVYDCKHRQERRDAAKKYTLENYDSVRGRQKKQRRILREANPHKHRAEVKAWRENNPEKYLAMKRKQGRLRRARDCQYNLTQNVRHSVGSALKRGGGEKLKRTEGYLGCSFPHFRAHIEKQFWAGMAWTNQGQWQLDHIKPCASFNLRDPAQQAVCFHWSNWQPLWADDNLAKSDRLNWTPAESKHTQ